MKKIVYSLLTVSLLFSSVEARELTQQEVNAKAIKKTKKELKVLHNYKDKGNEITAVPEESTSKYEFVDKKSSVDLSSAIQSEYMIQKEGIIFDKENKIKENINMTFESTGSTSKINDKGQKEYLIIQKRGIKLLKSGASALQTKQMILDKDLNIIKFVDEEKINDKVVNRIVCDLSTNPIKNPLKVVPIYTPAPFQFKCDDKSVITKRMVVDLGRKEFEGSLKVSSRIRTQDELTNQKTTSYIDSDGKVYDIKFYEENDRSIILTK